MASLLGKADSTIVQAAFNESLSDVPFDMSDVYQKRADNFSDFTDMINEQFDEQNKKDKEAKEAIDKQVSDIQTNIAGGKRNDGYDTVLNDQALAVSDELKNYDGEKNTLEYKRIEAKMLRLVSISESNADTWKKLINSDVSTLGSGKEVDLFIQMLNDQNHNLDDSSITYNKEKGDFEYTLKGDPTVKMTISELEKVLALEDPSAPTAATKVLTDMGANKNKRPYDQQLIDDTKNLLLKTMKTPNGKHNVMIEHFPNMKYSFHEALGGKDPKMQRQIFDVLEALPGVGLDIDNDKVKDTRDMYLNAENHHAIKEAIMNSHHGDEILADWIVKNAGEDIYNQGKNAQETVTDTKPTIKQKQIHNLKSWATGTTPKEFGIGKGSARLNIKIDPINKTIIQTMTDGTSKNLDPQSLLDAMIGKVGEYDAAKLFGDLGAWNVELPIVKKKGKPGNRLGRFINSFASDNE